MGTNVVVQDQTSGVTITFDNVIVAGDTTVTISNTGPPPPTGFRLGRQRIYYDIQTTATIAQGSIITVCIRYDPAQYGGPLQRLRIFHLQGSPLRFVDVTTSHDIVGHIICGRVTSLSPFIVAIENTVPTINSFAAQPAVLEVGGSVDFAATFTDPDGDDTHTATFAFGDGQTGAGLISSGTVTISHSYTKAGVYTVTLTVSDDVGGVVTTSLFIAIYDPEGGFVTGGGWINSPAGAFRADGTLTGKATFGFVSKYQKGANVPTGQTEFQFKVANLNFHSDSYEWLVVAGAKAQYKGTGTINGAGTYRFMLTAIDGDLLAGGKEPDKFRIKIWGGDDADNGLVYDNQVGGSDTADPTTSIGGGSIVIHAK